MCALKQLLFVTLNPHDNRCVQRHSTQVIIVAAAYNDVTNTIDSYHNKNDVTYLVQS
jgi:hypothetical protein